LSELYKIIKFQNAKKIYLKNEVVSELITLDHKFSVAVAVVNGKNQAHYHKDRTEVYHIIEGSGKIILNNEEITVNSGDTILINPNVKHQIEGKNIKVLVICSPPFTREDYFPVK